MKAFRQAALAAALSALFVAQAWAIGDGPVVESVNGEFSKIGRAHV